MNNSDIDLMLIAGVFGFLQAVTLAYMIWIGRSTVDTKVIVAEMRSELKQIPIQQIANNRHRIENLEKAMEIMNIKCSIAHPEWKAKDTK